MVEDEVKSSFTPLISFLFYFNSQDFNYIIANHVSPDNRKYIGCDIREGLGVDKILDLHNIDLPPESVGTVLCLDTLEHVEYPHKALKEIHRILKSDGIVVISSAMNFPIHDEPCDYWRFTPAAFTSLLKPFSDSFIGFVGIKSFPHTIVGIGFKGAKPSISKFRNKY